MERGAVAASSFFAFWAVALLLIVTPGADWAFTLGAGLSGRSVLPAVGGLALGYAAMTAVVAAGVGALVAGSPALLTGLTVAGSGYLVWHGAATVGRPAAPTGTPDAPRATLLGGFGVSCLNPKGLLIFLALLPQFTNPDWSWPVAGQIGVLGLTFALTCAVFYLCLGQVARTVLHARPAAGRALGRVCGAAMIAVGITLVVERLTA
jgi:threonine/homoserine/homoserine lactone efflux protein